MSDIQLLEPQGILLLDKMWWRQLLPDILREDLHNRRLCILNQSFQYEQRTISHYTLFSACKNAILTCVGS